MASYLESAIQIAQEAGAILQQYAQRRIGFELKGEHDLVTAADRASEALVVERLRTYFPSHDILAEEGGGHDRGSEYCWYVDPLDGTTNFAHGFPIYNVTLALAHKGEMIAGVVYDPNRNELFTAEKGSGAYLNHHRMHVSPVVRLQDALLSTGFPSRKRHENVNIHFYYQMAMLTHGVRRAGAAAIDLAWVACGRLDGFWEFGLKPWDMAAGTLIIEEAGGRCTDMRGVHRGIERRHLLATNSSIHDETLQHFGEIFSGKFRYDVPEVTTYSE